MPTIALVALAGRNNASDDSMLLGTIAALREVAPAAKLRAIVPDARRVASLTADVEWVPAPMQALGRLWPEGKPFLRSQRVRRAAEQLLDGALAGRDVPAEVRESVDAVASSDLVLYAGGAYLNGLRPLAIHNAEFLAQAAARQGLPWALFGHSVGPFREAAPSVRVKRLLEGAVSLGIRESRSAWEARSLAPSVRPEVVGDPTLLLPAPAHAEPADRLLVDARDFEFRLYPSRWGEPELSLGDAVTMISSRLKLEVSFAEAAAPPSHDDASFNERLDAMVLPTVRRGPRVTASSGAFLPPARVTLAASYHVCLQAMAQGRPAVAVATNEYSRHKLRGLMELFERPEWVWTPEAGIVDLVERVTSAANDPKTDALLGIVDDLAARQREWLRRVLGGSFEINGRVTGTEPGLGYAREP